MSGLKGLSGSLGRIVTGLSDPDTEEPVVQSERFKAVKPKKSADKTPKSKDPEWKGYSLFLKKDTHSEMNFILRRQDKGDDMSDLVQRLVDQWVKVNR